MHRGFGEGSPSVMVGAFPVRPAREADAFDSTVSFERARFIVKDGAGPRWCNQTQSRLARGNIAAAPVIGNVADDFPGGGKVSGGQDGIEGLLIVSLAWGYETGDNQGGGWIDAEMDLAVGASLLPMDSGEPGIGTSDLKAR